MPRVAPDTEGTVPCCLSKTLSDSWPLIDAVNEKPRLREEATGCVLGGFFLCSGTGKGRQTHRHKELSVGLQGAGRPWDYGQAGGVCPQLLRGE